MYFKSTDFVKCIGFIEAIVRWRVYFNRKVKRCCANLRPGTLKEIKYCN